MHVAAPASPCVSSTSALRRDARLGASAGAPRQSGPTIPRQAPERTAASQPAYAAVVEACNRSERVRQLAAVIRLETPWLARLVDFFVSPCRRGVALRGLCEGLVLGPRGVEVAARNGDAAFAKADGEALARELEAQLTRLAADPTHLPLQNIAGEGRLATWALRVSPEDG